VQLRESEYFALIEMVAELRKIKGAGEIRENLTNALIAYGRWNGEPIGDQRASEIIAARTESKLLDVEVRTQEILKRYEKMNAFKNMIQRKRP